MKTQAIEVEGLPEGWKAVAYRFGKFGESYLFNGKIVTNSFSKTEHPVLIVEKIQPLKIVLEDAGEERNRPRLNSYTYFYTDSEGFDRFKVLREVKETDIPLNSDDSTKWAEDLILQLPEHHEGRNSWLCHYGMSNQAEEKRKSSIFEYVKSVGRFNISKRKDK